MGRDSESVRIPRQAAISIHAPRMGRDIRARNLGQPRGISIHAPRMGRDVEVDSAILMQLRFQSTRPVWGATNNVAEVNPILRISIHAPRMGRDILRTDYLLQSQLISIHAPRMGRDFAAAGGFLIPGFAFQSTRPVWGATGSGQRHPYAAPISIHAPRMGRDVTRKARKSST